MKLTRRGVIKKKRMRMALHLIERLPEKKKEETEGVFWDVDVRTILLALDARLDFNYEAIISHCRRQQRQRPRKKKRNST